MRYYGFANFMLSSIQQGVQNFHVLSEMFAKYDVIGLSSINPAARDVLHDWANNHKTAILLNGGNADGVRYAYERIQRLGDALNLPYAQFYEDQQSLDGSMTACGIVVPTHIVELMGLLDNSSLLLPSFTEEEMELADFIRQYSLAR